jgi:hypothetical protein
MKRFGIFSLILMLSLSVSGLSARHYYYPYTPYPYYTPYVAPYPYYTPYGVYPYSSGAAAGALGGAATGALIGGAAGGGRGAAIGGAVGGLTGLAIGAAAEGRSRKKRYYNDYKYRKHKRRKYDYYD